MPELASLTIDHSPNKTTYFVGDRFERYGMVVKAHYDDGSSSTIDFYFKFICFSAIQCCCSFI